MNRSLSKTKLITNSLLELGLEEDEGKGKGRYFVSKFIEAGLAHYKELGDILITKETLDKFIQTMVGCPVIIDHEDVNDKNVDKLRVGVISRVWYNEADGWYYCEGILTDNEAIDLVKNKGWSVSCSYSFISDDTQKTYHGKPIDMEFTDGEFLHLAIVETPRYEGANIVVNKKDDDIKWITVKGNHIPIKKGQSKDEAVKEFLKDKQGSEGKKQSEKSESVEKVEKNKIGEKINSPKDLQKNKEYVAGSKIDFGNKVFPKGTKMKYKENYGGAYSFEINGEEYDVSLDDVAIHEIKEPISKKEQDFINKAAPFATIYKHPEMGILSYTPDDDTIEDINGNFYNGEDLKENGEWKKLKKLGKQEDIKNSIDKENIVMTVLNDLTDFIKKVVNNEKEDEMKVKNEDKRKLIDEIGGILKGKVDDEIIKTIIKKAEELSYEPSEDDKTDNKKAKNEDDEKEAKNKCKNEEDKEDKKVEDEEDKEEDPTKNEDDGEEEKTENKKVKNSMKDFVMGGSNKVEEKSLYTSRAKRLEEGNKY